MKVLFYLLLLLSLTTSCFNKKDKNTNIKEEFINEIVEASAETFAEEINPNTWEGGPDAFPKDMLTDLYVNIFYEGINCMRFISDYDNEITLFGVNRAQVCVGIYGISHYTGLQKGIHNFNKANNISSKPEDEELKWGDLSYATDFLGIDLFDNKKQKAKGFDFRCINPEVIKWVSENLIPEPNDVLDNITYQEIYNKIGSRYFRTTMESYIYLKSNNLEQAVSSYQDATQNDDIDGRRYLSDKYKLAFNNYPIYSDMSLDELTPEIAIGYWLRRFMDGSAKEFYNAHYKVITKYDNEWFLDKLKFYNLPEYNLHLGPGEDIMQMHHIANIFPISNEDDDVLQFTNDNLYNTDDDMQKGDSSSRITAIYHTGKNKLTELKDLDIDKPNFESYRAFFGKHYKIKDYDLLTFGFNGKDGKYLFALVFNNEKVYPEPLLLNFEVPQDDKYLRMTSEVSINANNSLEVITTSVKFTKTNAKEKGLKKMNENKHVFSLNDFLPFAEVY